MKKTLFTLLACLMMLSFTSAQSPAFLDSVSDIVQQAPAGECRVPVTFNVTATGDPAPEIKYYIDYYGPLTEIPNPSNFDPHYAYSIPNNTIVTVIASNVNGSDTATFKVTLIAKKLEIQCTGPFTFYADSGSDQYCYQSSDRHFETLNKPGFENYNAALIITKLPQCVGVHGPYYKFEGATPYPGQNNKKFKIGKTKVTGYAWDEGDGFDIEDVLDSFSFVNDPIEYESSRYWDIVAKFAESCSFDITVLDNQKPTISCISNQMRTTNFSGNHYAVSGTEFDPVFSDNHKINSIINDYTNTSTLAGSALSVGTRRIKWTVTDSSGNFDTCSFLVTITHCGANILGSANDYNGDITLSTQTQMDAFFNGTNGFRYTKVNGNLMVKGNNSADPISNLCNLGSLEEVTGKLEIRQFNQSENPIDLSSLSEITTLGRLTIISNPKLETIILPNLKTLNGSMYIRGNDYAKTIYLPKLETMYGSWFNVTRNRRVSFIRFSNEAPAFTFTKPKKGNLQIEDNGNLTADSLVMDFNKIKTVNQYFIFNNNSNQGVYNLDNIFGSLDTVLSTMIIRNNSHLAECCIAASAITPKGRSIYGNTGNCEDLTAISNFCGPLNKKGKAFAINDLSLQTTLVLYPNPSQGKMGMDFLTEVEGNLNVTVLDMLGRSVYLQNFQVNASNFIPINLEQLSEGQFILKAEFNGESFTKRIVIIK